MSEPIRPSFLGGQVERIAAARHPGESRLYARVVAPGTVRAGAVVRVDPGPRAPTGA